ncbi:MAG TPA: hypothetical protein VFF33_01520 [Ignavibacteriaceae bacterium]|nr:hypothetical protein [Ignavibacteriaceae bacterium]
MNFVKQYIAQSIIASSNNLRLSSQKIEVVTLLKELILKSEDLEGDIKKLKKVTQFSTLAIRFNEIYNYLTQTNLDFLKVSDKFKEHCQYLIKDIGLMLDKVSPAMMHEIKDKIKESKPIEVVTEDETSEQTPNEDEIKVDLSKRKPDSVNFENDTTFLKEKLILEEEKELEDNFKNYEENILKPINPLDSILKKLLSDKSLVAELEPFTKIMKRNSDHSLDAGFEILANMHMIVHQSILLLMQGKLEITKETIESIRACLIVIAAVIKGKSVDITVYLNKAERFGQTISTIK